MICPVCKGSRAVYRKVENIVTLTHCPKCNGVGEVEDPTNEQWFNSLSTKEKANVLSNIAYSSAESATEILCLPKDAENKKWELWLKAVHK